MIISKIAFRNIFRHKRRSALTAMMMAGGCFLFAIFIGMIDGSYDNLIEMFTRDRTGHIQVHSKGYLDKPSIYKTIDEPESAGDTIKTLDHVLSWAPRVYTPALAFAGKKTTGIKVTGIDPVREGMTTRLKNKIDRGRFISETPRNEIVISKGLSGNLKAGIGDEIAIIAQGVDGSIANNLFTVSGITGKGSGSFGSSVCYMHIKTAQEFLGLPGSVHEIAVVLTDHARTDGTVGLIKNALKDPSLDVEPWQDVESQFYKAMKADIKGNRYAIMVFTIIIAVGVLNTVLMIILERTREFGIMKALGTRPFQIFMLILLETAFLSVFSIIIGIITGILANWYLAVYGITFSTPIEYGGYFFDRLTAKITLKSLVMPAVIIFGTAVFVSVWPALRAARIVPVKAIRSN